MKIIIIILVLFFSNASYAKPKIAMGAGLNKCYEFLSKYEQSKDKVFPYFEGGVDVPLEEISKLFDFVVYIEFYRGYASAKGSYYKMPNGEMKEISVIIGLLEYCRANKNDMFVNAVDEVYDSY